MQQRRLGRTGHMSTVAVFGGFALYYTSQAEADAVMARVISAGVNHIDVSPTYGMAEERLGPWLARERQRFFLGGKTKLRTRQEAADRLRRSLETLRTDHFDVYQFHEVCTLEELDQITAPGGALEAVVEARAEGLTRYIGICGHGWEAPNVFLEALRRFDFDTLLFPVNFILFANPSYRQAAEALLAACRDRDVGVMAIKAVAKQPWGERSHTYTTWYEPFDDPAHIQSAVNFTLSQDVTALCTAGDPTLLPLILQACEQFTPLSAEQQRELLASAAQYQPLF